MALGGTVTSVTFQDHPFALRRVSAEWRRPFPPYETRRDHLLGNILGGRNRPYLLEPATVIEDATADTSAGGSGRDWFVASIATQDSLLDPAGDETVTLF